MKWYRLVKESNDKISFEEFKKMFWDYCEVVNEFFVLDGFKSENKKELVKKMDDFHNFVKWNTSWEYQKIEPRWGQILDKVISDLEDDICDADGDYRNSKYVYNKIFQLYYDFMNFHNVLGTKPYWELEPLERKPVNESSRFGFNVGDKVELTKDKVNSISGDVFEAGTQGEVVAVDKPMKGVIKVKIEGGKVVSVPERQLKFAGTDNEPWEKFKKPEEPKRHVRPERPEDYYMRPTSYGSPRYTGD